MPSYACNHTGPCNMFCTAIKALESWANPMNVVNMVNPSSCDHCYCQMAPAVNGVLHKACCKCKDTRKGVPA